VGEIRGREKAEQILVVGGHLDSWDLGQGTTDNGSGTATVLGAAEAIAHSGQRPRRTIRFVLFTGEEQGLDGSFAYIKQHQSEMANHLGNLVLDAGQGAVKGFQMEVARGGGGGGPGGSVPTVRRIPWRISIR